MDNSFLPSLSDQNDPKSSDLSQNSEAAGDSSFNYLAKPELEETKSRFNVWVRSLSSLALYFVIGYFFFNKDWTFVLILTAVVVFHELGHFFMMKVYNYTDLGIFFIPLLGAYASGTKREISQTQSAIIILAGPVPGILLGIILHFVGIANHSLVIEQLSWSLVFLNLLNLFPVYPLDGGQLINRLFLDESTLITKIFIVISSLALAWFFWNMRSSHSFIFYLFLLIPVMMISRLFSDIKHERLIKKIEEEGVDLNTPYEEISDEQYWKIRAALLKYHPDLSGVKAGGAYEYAEQEDKIVTVLQTLLQRIIIMDLSIAWKIFIVVLWIACFVMPFLLDLPLRPPY